MKNIVVLFLIILFIGCGDMAKENVNTKACPLPDGYVSYGPFDKDGIPMRDFKGSLGVVYHPLVVAEYGSYYHSLYLQTKEKRYLKALENMADWLVNSQNNYGFLVYQWNSGYMGIEIKAPWSSAVTQGFAAQTLLKAYALTKKSQYLKSAKSALLALKRYIQDGGLRYRLEEGSIYEEIPTLPPTHILNGHLTTIQAMKTFLKVENNSEIEKLYNSGIEGVKRILDNYDTGYWSKYDLLPPLTKNMQKVYLEIDGAGDKVIDAVLEFDNIIEKIILKKSIKKGLLTINNNPISFDNSLYEADILLANNKRLIDKDEKITINLNDLSLKVIKGYVSWKENKNVLLSIDVKDNSVKIPVYFLGHSTGLSYHKMVIGQLKRLYKDTNETIFNQYAIKWDEYTKKYEQMVLQK